MMYLHVSLMTYCLKAFVSELLTTDEVHFRWLISVELQLSKPQKTNIK